MRSALISAVVVLAAGCNLPWVPPKGPGPPVGVVVEYPSGKETVRGLVYRTDVPQRLAALVVVHEDHGLTPWVKQQAQELAKRGYVTLAVDLYRGATAGDVLDAHIMDRGLPEDRVLRDLKATVDYLAGRNDVKADSIGIIGWDSGGGYALDAAIADSRLRSAVVCYGRLTTDPARLAPLQASVLGVFAGKDEGISAETIEQFRAAMQKAGKRLAGIHVFPDSPHGFMNPANHPGQADWQATKNAQDAWFAIHDHLREELKPW